jgi:hypothetical protein
MKRSLRQQLNRCRHFTGIQHDTCKAGVRYDDVRKQGQRMSAFPCFQIEADNMPADGVWPTCATSSFKTAAELDADEAEIKKQTVDMFTARGLIVEYAKVSGEQQGAIPCPICAAGKLGYSIASNGHVLAKCSTEKCVAWME